MKIRKFEKKELIIKPGDVCQDLYLIKKGLVRSYIEIEKQEVTSWISIDNDVFTSIMGFFSQTPTQEYIESLEETHVEYMSYEDMQEGLKLFPDFQELNRILLEKYYEAAEIRALIVRIPKAKNRFNYFKNNYNPLIINRTPKRILASFLAMRPETLSRLINDEIDS